MAKEDLKPVRTKEEAKIRGRNGGIKSGEARRAKKTMREVAKMLMALPATGNMSEQLDRLGIEKTDHNFQTAMVVGLAQKAALGDTSAFRLLAELTGDLGAYGQMMPDPDALEVKYPIINIPDNGRDKNDSFTLGPQAGPQTAFMASPADIVIYGGAAGGGKTFALLLEALRHKDVQDFGAVIFRQNFTQITAQGGLWDASRKIFSQVEGAYDRKTPKLSWIFGNKSKLSFAYLAREDDLDSWQGTEIAYIGFDELTHFTKHQFLYMLSRNRSTCGIKPYVRATCNPDSDSWVADFISWWIDQDTGYPIKNRSGVMRWMCVLNDTVYWADTAEELSDKYGIEPSECKTVTFIASNLHDNKILMEKDPSYLANLKALTEVDMERLLYGNWKIKAQAGKYFKRTQVEMLDAIPNDVLYWCRAWDLAATDEDENGDADYTSGVLVGKRKNGRFVIADVINQRIKAGEVEKLILSVSTSDRKKYGYQYRVRVPQDPGAAGKIVAKRYINVLAGFDVVSDTVSGSKESRATPLAAQWQNGFIDVVAADWNEEFFNQLESFPESKHDDMVDAVSDAFNELSSMNFDIGPLL